MRVKADRGSTFRWIDTDVISLLLLSTSKHTYDLLLGIYMWNLVIRNFKVENI